MSPVQHLESNVRQYFEGIGRRKTAVARVRVLPHGKGTITVNGRAWEEYFPVVSLQKPVVTPLELTATREHFDISVNVSGGGIHAQADAVKLGLARALVRVEEQYRKPLRAADALRRDPREKERKKPGLKRARRAPQWQKR